MENKGGINFLEFLNKAILQDQTKLINEILKADKTMDYIDSIMNREHFSVKLSDEEIIGTTEVITEKQSQVEKELAMVNSLIDEKQVPQGYYLFVKNEIEKELKLLEDAKGWNRHIFQWLLVPHWLGDELINYGEVVFREFGCNWWGITTIIGDHQSKESTLLEIFEELHNY